MDTTGKVIRRIEFNWFYTTSNGEAVLNYDIETNAEEIEEGVDGWFWIKLKNGEIHKVNNINTIYYDTPKDKDERLPELD